MMATRKRCEWCEGHDWPTTKRDCGHVLCEACARYECPCCVEKELPPGVDVVEIALRNVTVPSGASDDATTGPRSRC